MAMEDEVELNNVLGLKQILNSLSQCTGIEDTQKLETSVSELVDFVDSIYVQEEDDYNEEEEALNKENAVEILNELLSFISNPSLDQVVVDALSFVLPKLVFKFSGVSKELFQIGERVLDRLISTCSPRDMLTVICEVLDAHKEMSKEPAFLTPLFAGLSKVLISLQRRHFEHIKEALPAVLKVLQAFSSELDDETQDSFQELIDRAIGIANSIQEVCQKLEGKQKNQIRALLGLYVLQLMALSSSTLGNVKVPLMLQLSKFLPFCNLSYFGLGTGGDVEAITDILGECDEYMSSFSLIKQGAFIAVVWGFMSNEVAKAAGQELGIVKDNLQNSQTKRWQAVGMLKHVLSSINQPWQLKEHVVDFFLSIMEGDICQKSSNEHSDCSIFVPSLYSAMKAIEMVLIYAPNAVLRKKTFAALKMVLADIPSHQRFDILKASITTNNCPSMAAILIGFVKEEMLKEYRQKGLLKKDEVVVEGDEVCPRLPFWGTNVLELVEMLLKPPQGGPPCLPEQSDTVLSILNLYRFLLITESTGKTNYTGVLSEVTLRKAYTEWLLPLRTVVSGIMAENEKDCCEFEVDDICAFNPLQLVLHRCIELVEEKLQQS